MERVTDEQLQASHSGTDSLAYKLLSERREAEAREGAINRAAGCLIKEGRELGFSSLTPAKCPVERCEATFGSGGLRVVNEGTCQSPIDKPQPKYPLGINKY